jgi:hypothetical protein
MKPRNESKHGVQRPGVILKRNGAGPNWKSTLETNTQHSAGLWILFTQRMVFSENTLPVQFEKMTRKYWNKDSVIVKYLSSIL